LSELIVDNLPMPIYEECRKIELLHELFEKGIDPFWYETNEDKILINDNDEFEKEALTDRGNQQEGNKSVNLEELYHLTQIIQDEIWNVTRNRPTGKIRIDRINQQIVDQFLESGIDNYAMQLEIFIKSLIIDDGWSPERFRGYPYLLQMIRDTKGRTKMNHLQALMNKARVMIPPDVAVKHIEIIEPALTKSANPSDA
jgi:hypothetical protein